MLRYLKNNKKDKSTIQEKYGTIKRMMLYTGEYISEESERDFLIRYDSAQCDDAG